MAQRPRIHYTVTQKAVMWDRWQLGESLHEIAKLFDRHHSAVRRILAETGGIRPMQGPQPSFDHRIQRTCSRASLVT